ncbi:MULTISPECIES: BRO family protein [Staphylococcus]|uniref:BRO-N domain-containing protein n=1 Tax=Staphylococcus TaxID=1279 RepID=UPI000946B68A|nr:MULTISPECIES: BRO family protein [Staphylococcus]OLF31679.1 phage repressor protein [Staphylococcus sp. 47.1]PIS60885.1 antirepressor [Corynebacterium striatum]
MIKQFFGDKEIRFVEKDDEYWAVAGDVAKALGYRDGPNMTRNIDKEDITTHIMSSNKKGNPNITIVSEYGIYEAIWNSRRDEAQEFKKWVKQVIKELRQATGLEAYEAFGMLDKNYQKTAMDVLNNGIDNITSKEYIKANTIADKATSTVFGFKKMVKKADMNADMLKLRQKILDDVVQLMVSSKKFGLTLSISKTIYDKYHNQQVIA